MLLNLFWEFFKIGSFTLGGGAAMLPQIQELVVEDKKWLSQDEMLDCIALGQSLPGIIAVNTATYIGYRKGGLRGAAAATIGVTLPAFLAIILAVSVLEFIGDNPYVEGAFTGVKAAVCGLIFMTAVKLFKQFKGDKKTIVFSSIASIVSLVLVGFAGVNAVWLIIAGIIAGIAFNSVREARR